MKIEIEIPKEFIVDWESDRFEDFFERALADMNGDGYGGNYERETAKMFICAFKNGIINNQPQVQQWVPCSERLPEKTGYYLITYSRKYCQNEMAVGFFSREDYDTDFGNPWEVSTYGDLKEILAWQPLPQPYTENRKES